MNTSTERMNAVESVISRLEDVGCTHSTMPRSYSLVSSSLRALDGAEMLTGRLADDAKLLLHFLEDRSIRAWASATPRNLDDAEVQLYFAWSRFPRVVGSFERLGEADRKVIVEPILRRLKHLIEDGS